MELAIDRIPAEGIQQRMLFLESELIDALRETIHSGQYLQGEAVRHLEERIEQTWGCRVAAATHSGTSSLQIALLAAGVKAGDEVIVPAISFVSTSFAVNSVSAIPVFVDVDPMTLTIDPSAVDGCNHCGPSLRANGRYGSARRDCFKAWPQSDRGLRSGA